MENNKVIQVLESITKNINDDFKKNGVDNIISAYVDLTGKEASDTTNYWN